MRRRIFATGIVFAWLSACGSDESGNTAQSGTGGSAGNGVGGASGADAGDCDPLPGKTDAGGEPGDGGLVGEGGGIDLDGGSPLPPGKLKCYDPGTGAGFDCTLSGQVCCEKKDQCYDPSTEPTFCDKPWCA